MASKSQWSFGLGLPVSVIGTAGIVAGVLTANPILFFGGIAAASAGGMSILGGGIGALTNWWRARRTGYQAVPEEDNDAAVTSSGKQIKDCFQEIFLLKRHINLALNQESILKDLGEENADNLDPDELANLREKINLFKKRFSFLPQTITMKDKSPEKHISNLSKHIQSLKNMLIEINVDIEGPIRNLLNRVRVKLNKQKSDALHPAQATEGVDTDELSKSKSEAQDYPPKAGEHSLFSNSKAQAEPASPCLETADQLELRLASQKAEEFHTLVRQLSDHLASQEPVKISVTSANNTTDNNEAFNKQCVGVFNEILSSEASFCQSMKELSEAIQLLISAIKEETTKAFHSGLSTTQNLVHNFDRDSGTTEEKSKKVNQSIVKAAGMTKQEDLLLLLELQNLQELLQPLADNPFQMIGPLGDKEANDTIITSLESLLNAMYSRKMLTRYTNMVVLTNNNLKTHGLFNHYLPLLKLIAKHSTRLYTIFNSNSDSQQIKEVSPSIRDGLIMPMQRIARYPLLAGDLSKHFNPGQKNKDQLTANEKIYEQLMQLLEIAKNAALVANESRPSAKYQTIKRKKLGKKVRGEVIQGGEQDRNKITSQLHDGARKSPERKLRAAGNAVQLAIKFQNQANKEFFTKLDSISASIRQDEEKTDVMWSNGSEHLNELQKLLNSVNLLDKINTDEVEEALSKKTYQVLIWDQIFKQLFQYEQKNLNGQEDPGAVTKNIDPNEALRSTNAKKYIFKPIQILYLAENKKVTDKSLERLLKENDILDMLLCTENDHKTGWRIAHILAHRPKLALVLLEHKTAIEKITSTAQINVILSNDKTILNQLCEDERILNVIAGDILITMFEQGLTLEESKLFKADNFKNAFKMKFKHLQGVLVEKNNIKDIVVQMTESGKYLDTLLINKPQLLSSVLKNETSRNALVDYLIASLHLNSAEDLKNKNNSFINKLPGLYVCYTSSVQTQTKVKELITDRLKVDAQSGQQASNNPKM